MGGSLDRVPSADLGRENPMWMMRRTLFGRHFPLQDGIH